MGRQLSQEAAALEQFLAEEGMPAHLPRIDEIPTEEYLDEHEVIIGNNMRHVLLGAGIDPKEFKTALARDPEGLRDWVMRNLGILN